MRTTYQFRSWQSLRLHTREFQASAYAIATPSEPSGSAKRCRKSDTRSRVNKLSHVAKTEVFCRLKRRSFRYWLDGKRSEAATHEKVLASVPGRNWFPALLPSEKNSRTTNEQPKTLHPTTSTPNRHSKWAVFTPRERVSPPAPSPTRALLPHGSRPLPSRSLTRSASSPVRVPPLRRLVSSSVTPTVLPRSRLSLVRLYCRIWNPQAKD